MRAGQALAGHLRTGSLAMPFVEASQSANPNSHEEAVPVGDPRHMTRAQLRQLGMPRIVYLRSGTIDGHTAYAIHAADGTAMAIVEDIELAVELASEYDMTFVPVH
jgi:hypothetical protein